MEDAGLLNLAISVRVRVGAPFWVGSSNGLDARLLSVAIWVRLPSDPPTLDG